MTKKQQGKAKETKLVESLEEEAKRQERHEEGLKGLTLRLNLAAWRQLKTMGIEENRTMHSLLLEAVDDLFEKYGLERIAK